MKNTVEKKYSFQVSSDTEAYEKVMEAKRNYEKNGISYSIEESYAKVSDYITKKKNNV